MMRPTSRTVFVLCFTLYASLAGRLAGACETLAALDLGHVEITGAQFIAAGEFRLPVEGPFAARITALNTQLADTPALCRVTAVARPTTDSQIGIEIWLPSENWNGMLQSVGNGAWAGSISYQALIPALAHGYAAASTDTGHIGNNVDFAIGHPEKLVDFAHRAVHEMTMTAKAVIREYYSRPPDQAYFIGCSTGGRQALAEAQRYPEDYDGIVAGAAAYYPSHLQGMQVWTAAVTNRQPGPGIGPAEFALVNDAVTAACDTLDGVADGVLENPAACEFDPASLVCANGDTQSCLSPAQAQTVASIYQGPVETNGDSIFPGLARGSETGWQTLSGNAPLSLAFDTYARLVFNDPDWNFVSFDAAVDIPIGAERIGALMNSADPDLSPFIGNGGKLLLYHGWSDPGIPADASVRYYTEVRETLGADTADDSVRLFMVPGMGHCRGGIGTDQFDPAAALDRWVRTDVAPARIEASRIENGSIVRTRPLCAFPATAVYDGSGSTDTTENFECRE